MKNKSITKINKKIYCNILGKIQIEDEIIHQLIFSKEFQRLHRIKQLGLAYTLFPGATHTRFSHSLGVYELARRFLNHLSQKNKISYELQLSIKIAALLHDIGHGPMSHFFEEINLKKHEEYSIEIIKSKFSEINKILTLHLNQEQIESIIKIIKKSHELPWINQLISSEVDVDRLDYLLRDSIQTGTKYGLVDLEWIISNSGIKDKQLYFEKDALQTIESVMLGRYHMYTRVYYNPKTMAFSLQFNFLFKKLKELFENNYVFKTDISKISNILNNKILTTKQLLELTDDTILGLVQELNNETDKTIKQITNNILKGTIPKIYELNSLLHAKEFDKYAKDLTENIHFGYMTLNYNFDFYNDIQNEPSFLLNNQLVKISSLSSIIRSRDLEEEEKIVERLIGVII